MVEPALAPRKFSRMDAGRAATMLFLLAVVFAVWYFILLWSRELIVPTVPGGRTGPWLVYPNIAARFCACAFLAAVSLPFVMTRLRKRWNAQDAAAGTQYDPYRDRPLAKIGPFLAGGILAVLYGIALLAYFSDWTVVGPAGIDERFLWRRRAHSFDQIKSLEIVSRALRRDEDHLVGNSGPWHKVEFTDGRIFDFGPENEGCSDADISAIEKFIADRSGKTWRVRGGAGRR